MGIRRILALASFLVITGSLFGQRNANPVEANKKIVFDFYRYVWEPKDDQALMNWLPESYLEHNPMFPGGRSDLGKFLKSRRTGPPPKVADKLSDPPELIVAEEILSPGSSRGRGKTRRTIPKPTIAFGSIRSGSRTARLWNIGTEPLAICAWERSSVGSDY